MKRRDFIKAAAVTAGAHLISSGNSLSPAADAVIELRPCDAQQQISRHIYGHFLEHLGGVVYDGVWVGTTSKIPNIGGIRKEFVDDMRRIGAANFRYPGGCYADGYHWRDGIGPVARRPRTYNTWGASNPGKSSVTESNIFGTDEFMRLCRLIGAEPYLSLNVNSGTPQEAHDWALYCNAPSGSVSLADERARNGHREPYNVKFWGIGNESWGCGGRFTPEEYAAALNRITAQFPRFTEPFFVAVGPNSGSTFDPNVNTEWTKGFFESTATLGRRRANAFAMHYYTKSRPNFINSKALDFTPAQWYEVLDYGRRVEDAIDEHWKIMGEYDKDHKVKLVVDEWGVWHLKGEEARPEYLYSQIGTLRDALHAALTLDVFNRHADKIVMSNIAQVVNTLHSLFLAYGSKFVRTPTYYIYEMYRTHHEAKLVPMTIKADELEFAKQQGRGRMPHLSGSASVRDNQLALTLVNPSLDNDMQVTVRTGGATMREAKGRILTADEMAAANTFEAKDRVAPSLLAVTIAGSDLKMNVPRKSVVAIQILLG